MSLIVARKRDNFVALVSDTKLNLPNETTPTLADTALKTLLISKEVCIAFAGNIHFAEELFRTLSPEMSVGKIVTRALDSHINSELETDYIVMALTEGVPKLFSLKDGVERKLTLHG